MSATKPFSWAAATAPEISRHCGLENLPPNLIEQVLPRFRAFLKEYKHAACSNSCESDPAQIPATVVSNASTLHQNPLPPSVEQLFSSFSTPEQPTASVVPWTESTEWLSMTDCFTWGSETVPAEVPTTEPPSKARQPLVGSLTHEDVEALLQEQDGAGLEPIMEGPSAALEFLLDIEYSRMVEAGLGEYPLALPTREDVEGSLFPPPSNTNSSAELAQGTGMGGIETGGFDFSHFLDGWEG